MYFSVQVVTFKVEKSKNEQPAAENSESQPKEEGKVETTEQPQEQSSLEETKVKNSSTEQSQD